MKSNAHQKAYKQVLNAAVKWFKFQVSMAKEDGMDNEDSLYRSVHEVMQDAKDLVTIAYWLDKGKIGKAANKANMLDTIVRDQIPRSAWSLFEKYWEDK